MNSAAAIQSNLASVLSLYGDKGHGGHIETLNVDVGESAGLRVTCIVSGTITCNHAIIRWDADGAEPATDEFWSEFSAKNVFDAIAAVYNQTGHSINGDQDNHENIGTHKNASGDIDKKKCMMWLFSLPRSLHDKFVAAANNTAEYGSDGGSAQRRGWDVQVADINAGMFRSLNEGQGFEYDLDAETVEIIRCDGDVGDAIDIEISAAVGGDGGCGDASGGSGACESDDISIRTWTQSRLGLMQQWTTAHMNGFGHCKAKGDVLISIAKSIAKRALHNRVCDPWGASDSDAPTALSPMSMIGNECYAVRRKSDGVLLSTGSSFPQVQKDE